MSTVFIPQVPIVRGTPQDTTDARRFGQRIVVFSPESSGFRHEIYADNVDERMPELIRHAQATLEPFQTGKDYLAMTGAPLFLAICMSVLKYRHPLRMLRYDRKEHSYYLITL